MHTFLSLIVLLMVNRVNTPGERPPASSPNPANKSGLIADVFEGVVIVAGEVTSVTPLPEAPKNYATDLPVTIKITHVFYGDPDLAGATFMDYYLDPRDGFSRGFTSARTPFEKGEVGIWTLKMHMKKWRVHAHHLLPARSRKKRDGVEYDQVLGLAKALEEVHQSAPATQRKKFMELVHSPNPKVSAWAIGGLEVDRVPETADFLRKLANDPPASIWSQIALDKALVYRRGGDWMDSSARVAFFKRWADGKYPEEDTKLMLRVMVNRTKINELWLDPAAAARLVGIAATNTGQPVGVREYAMKLLPGITFHHGLVAPVCKPLLQVVRTDKSATLRRVAAGQLYLAIRTATMPTHPVDKLPADLIEEIRNLAESETDKDVSSSLGKALVCIQKQKAP